MNSDFNDLLSLFNAYQIKYLIVGGYAVIKYTEPRFTKDLHLWLLSQFTEPDKDDGSSQAQDES